MNEIIALILLLGTILTIHFTVFAAKNVGTKESDQIIDVLKYALPLREAVLIIFLFRYLSEAF